MKTIINLNKEPHECCPSFEVCETNKCPLHRNFSKLEDKPADKEVRGWRKCRSSKVTRMKIGLAFKLKNKGLTLRELSAMAQSIKMKALNFSTRDKLRETPVDSIGIPTLKTTEIQTKLIRGVENGK